MSASETQRPTITVGRCKRCGELVQIANLDGRPIAYTALEGGGWRLSGRTALAMGGSDPGTHTPHRRVCPARKEQP